MNDDTETLEDRIARIVHDVGQRVLAEIYVPDGVTNAEALRRRVRFARLVNLGLPDLSNDELSRGLDELQ